jgi:[acyl-carrier-protein] S-malonyltransferase
MTEHKILGMFPGQGSQEVGMGKNLYERSQLAKNYFHQADEVLGFKLSKLCFEGTIEELSKTENSQPAILTVSHIAYLLWQEETGKELSFAAGHSLGEYSALVSAKSLKFEDAINLVRNRGRYMQAAVPIGTGAMLAVLGMETEELEMECQKASNLNDNQIVEIANLNAPGQIVVSGEKEAVNRLKNNLSANGKKAVELNVSAPFHCSMMQPAADKLAIDLDLIEIKDSQFPIIANVKASAHSSAKEIRQALKEQVCGRVRWSETFLYAKEVLGSTEAIEFGAGKILSGLAKRIDKSLSCSQYGS